MKFIYTTTLLFEYITYTVQRKILPPLPFHPQWGCFPSISLCYKFQIRQLFCHALIFFFSSTTYGQEISISTISPSGDYVKNEAGISVSWTMGQVFDQSIFGNYHFTEGFQQGTLSQEIQAGNRASLDETPSSNTTKKLVGTTNASIEILAYPNPVVDKLNLTFDNLHLAILTIKIIDSSGKHWAQQKVNNTVHTTIDIAHLPSGNYILQIIENGKFVCYKKIIKT